MSMAFSNYNDVFLSTGEAEDDCGLMPTWDDNEAWREKGPLKTKKYHRFQEYINN